MICRSSWLASTREKRKNNEREVRASYRQPRIRRARLAIPFALEKSCNKFTIIGSIISYRYPPLLPQKDGCMEETNKAEYIIEVSATDATDGELERMTRQLLSELKELDVESVELAKGESAPIGSKGDINTIGSIALEVLPDVLPIVITLVQSWILRGRGRVVKFKNQGIEFEGSPEELIKLLSKLG